jgi:hypothetical protein fgonA2_06654
MSTTKLTLAQKVANLNTPLTWDNIQNKPPFGTEANTILEGSKFIEGLGVNGYGGTIQDPGQKVAGKCYFDINTKSLFLCKTTNNLTSPNSDYFTSFDNKSLLNKLENLFIINNKRYDSGNIQTPISNNWISIATLNPSDKFINIVIFNGEGSKAINYLFHYNQLKIEIGMYFLVNATAGFGYSGGYLRLTGSTLQIKSTGDNSHKFFLRSLQIYY